MLDPFFPQNVGNKANYDDFTITTLKKFDLSHSIEYTARVAMHGSDKLFDVVIIQTKAWPKR